MVQKKKKKKKKKKKNNVASEITQPPLKVRSVNPEPVPGYWPIIGNWLLGPWLLKFNNQLRNWVPRLTDFYPVTWVKTSYPDRVVNIYIYILDFL
jgi:hypothetical protein